MHSLQHHIELLLLLVMFLIFCAYHRLGTFPKENNNDYYCCFCLTGLVFLSYSRLGWSPEVNVGAVLL